MRGQWNLPNIQILAEPNRYLETFQWTEFFFNNKFIWIKASFYLTDSSNCSLSCSTILVHVLISLSVFWHIVITVVSEGSYWINYLLYSCVRLFVFKTTFLSGKRGCNSFKTLELVGFATHSTGRRFFDSICHWNIVVREIPYRKENFKYLSL